VKAGAVDILEPDTEWCGGISEVTRICAARFRGWSQSQSPSHELNALRTSWQASLRRCAGGLRPLSMYMGTKYFEKNPIGHNGKQPD